MPTPDTFDAGAKAAAAVVLKQAMDLTGIGAQGLAVGQAPETIPYSVLGTLYTAIMALQTTETEQ